MSVYLDRPRKRRGRGLLLLLFLFVAGPVLALGLTGLFRSTPAPEVKLTADVAAVGRKGNVSVVVEEPERGISSIKVELVQSTGRRVLDERTFPSETPWKRTWKLIPVRWSSSATRSISGSEWGP